MGVKRGRESAHAEAVTSKRMEVVKRLKTHLENPNSVVSQTVNAYSNLLDDLFLEVALDVHRGLHTGQVDLADTVTDRDILPAWVPYPKQSKARTMDAFGQLVSNAGQKEVTCNHCGRCVAAARYAPHLENCLGMGRNGSRKARRKGDGPG